VVDEGLRELKEKHRVKENERSKVRVIEMQLNYQASWLWHHS
jgi:hypothetical protein